MKTGYVVQEIRRANLQSLIEAHGTVEGLAREVGSDPTYLVNIKNGVRNMGNAKARDIEKALTLPKGAMDAPNLGRHLPRNSELTPREHLLADVQRIYHVQKATAEKAIAMLDVLFNAKKKGKRGGR